MELGLCLGKLIKAIDAGDKEQVGEKAADLANYAMKAAEMFK